MTPTSIPQRQARRAGGRLRGAAAWLALLTLPAMADPPYPFEGAWVRTSAACTPATIRERLYTAKEVISPRGRCAIRRVAAGSGAYELLEDCRRNDRAVAVTETIRLTSPETMVLKRQLSRLKIPRQVHYMRCRAAAASPAIPAPGVKPGRPEPPSQELKSHDGDP